MFARVGKVVFEGSERAPDDFKDWNLQCHCQIRLRMTGSVRNDHYSVRNNPKERSSYLLGCGSLKSRILLVAYLLG